MRWWSLLCLDEQLLYLHKSTAFQLGGWQTRGCPPDACRCRGAEVDRHLARGILDKIKEEIKEQVRKQKDSLLHELKKDSCEHIH